MALSGLKEACLWKLVMIKPVRRKKKKKCKSVTLKGFYDFLNEHAKSQEDPALMIMTKEN